MGMQGDELRAIRKRDLVASQATLAHALGLTAQYIGFMENGKAPIEPRTELAVRYLVEHPEAIEVEFD